MLRKKVLQFAMQIADAICMEETILTFYKIKYLQNMPPLGDCARRHALQKVLSTGAFCIAKCSNYASGAIRKEQDILQKQIIFLIKETKEF